MQEKCSVYHLNIFGIYWPYHGKKIFENKDACMQFYEQQLRKAYKYWKSFPRKELDESLEDGASVTRINTCYCPKYQRLFREIEFFPNENPGRRKDHENDD